MRATPPPRAARAPRWCCRVDGARALDVQYKARPDHRAHQRLFRLRGRRRAAHRAGAGRRGRFRDPRRGSAARPEPLTQEVAHIADPGLRDALAALGAGVQSSAAAPAADAAGQASPHADLPYSAPNLCYLLGRLPRQRAASAAAAAATGRGLEPAVTDRADHPLAPPTLAARCSSRPAPRPSAVAAAWGLSAARAWRSARRPAPTEVSGRGADEARPAARSRARQGRRARSPSSSTPR